MPLVPQAQPAWRSGTSGCEPSRGTGCLSLIQVACGTPRLSHRAYTSTHRVLGVWRLWYPQSLPGILIRLVHELPMSGDPGKRALSQCGEQSAKRRKEEPAQRKYHSSVVRDNARGHFGDSHQQNTYHAPVYHYANQTQCSQFGPEDSIKRHEEVLESLRFDRMDDRFLTIKSAYSNTCEWLSGREEYSGWLDETKRLTRRLPVDQEQARNRQVYFDEARISACRKCFRS